MSRADSLRAELAAIDKRMERSRHRSEVALREAAIAWCARKTDLADNTDPNDNAGRKLDKSLQRAAVRFTEQHPEMLR